jgi:preprotein translocase subunit SecD
VAVDDPGDAATTAEVLRVLERRAQTIAVGACAVRATADGEVVVEIEAVDEYNELYPQDVGDLMTAVGLVEFLDARTDVLLPSSTVWTSLGGPDGSTLGPSTIIYETLASSADVVAAAQERYDAVRITLTDAAAQRLATFSQRPGEKHLSVVIDKIVVGSAPVQRALSSPFTLGRFEPPTDVVWLVACLNSGPLSRPLRLVSVEVARGALANTATGARSSI